MDMTDRTPLPLLAMKLRELTGEPGPGVLWEVGGFVHSDEIGV